MNDQSLLDKQNEYLITICAMLDDLNIPGIKNEVVWESIKPLRFLPAGVEFSFQPDMRAHLLKRKIHKSMGINFYELAVLRASAWHAYFEDDVAKRGSLMCQVGVLVTKSLFHEKILKRQASAGGKTNKGKARPLTHLKKRIFESFKSGQTINRNIVVKALKNFDKQSRKDIDFEIFEEKSDGFILQIEDKIRPLKFRTIDNWIFAHRKIQKSHAKAD